MKNILAALRLWWSAFVRRHIVDWDPDPEATLPPREDHAADRYEMTAALFRELRARSPIGAIIPEVKRAEPRKAWDAVADAEPTVRAPWDDRQKTALNIRQADTFLHPYTCGQCGGRLIATHSGWACPKEGMLIVQNWAHAYDIEHYAEPDELEPVDESARGMA
jgi:hypothetical protein